MVVKGKLKVPPVMSSDLRIAGPKTVAFQENRDEVAYAGANGWRAVVGGIKNFGHAEPEYQYVQSAWQKSPPSCPLDDSCLEAFPLRQWPHEYWAIPNVRTDMLTCAQH